MKIDRLRLGSSLPLRGMYRLGSLEPASIAPLLGARDLVRIELLDARNKLEIIQRVKSQLPLPDYCGENWDALEECLYEVGGEKVFVYTGLETAREITVFDYRVFLEIIFRTLAVNNLVLIGD